MRVWGLRLRVLLAVVLMFSLFYALIAVSMYLLGVNVPLLYILIAAGVMLFQYIIGPKIVDFVMNVNYITSSDEPRLYGIVAKASAKAGIPMPRVGISNVNIPNAFAFGRTMRDSRICVTRPLLKLLSDDELEAVIGHELSHIKNRDMIIVTALSVIPLICYYIFLSTVFSGYRSREGGAVTLVIGLGALVMYFITNLIVLYVSRVREYYADAGSVDLIGRPEPLASALYKLARSTLHNSEKEVKAVKSMKAFFAVDPTPKVSKEMKLLLEADVNGDGKLDAYELLLLEKKANSLGFTSRIVELFSTHPNILRRIARLSRYLH
ncbi:MAG: zinc metalloprotease HtpX [Candidatus Freyarchaeota archaeon]|nr:zinc metalloprotease HtpX [Candidatus Freyrarchaeum guaymaensis]